jgi:hypothetical protein
MSVKIGTTLKFTDGAKNDNLWLIVSEFQNDLDNQTFSHFLPIVDITINQQYNFYIKEGINGDHSPTG